MQQSTKAATRRRSSLESLSLAFDAEDRAAVLKSAGQPRHLTHGANALMKQHRRRRRCWRVYNRLTSIDPAHQRRTDVKLRRFLDALLSGRLLAEVQAKTQEGGRHDQR